MKQKTWFGALNLEVYRVDEKVVQALFHQQPFCRNLVKGNPTEPDKKNSTERKAGRHKRTKQTGKAKYRKLIVFLGN